MGVRTWGRAYLRYAPKMTGRMNGDGRAVTFGFGELDTLVPAYVATIHKSQGSEYPAVVIPVLTQHYAIPA